MAHLTCLDHGRRSVVVEHPQSDSRHRFYQVLHRGDKIKCNSNKVRHGKHEFSLITVALGLIKANKAAISGNNWTPFSEFDKLNTAPARPSRRVRRTRR